MLSLAVFASLFLSAETSFNPHLYSPPPSIFGIQLCPPLLLILFIFAEQHTSGDREAIEHVRNDGSSVRIICGSVGGGVGAGVGCGAGGGVDRGVGGGTMGLLLFVVPCCCCGLQLKLVGAKFRDILQTSCRIQSYPFETRA